MSVKTESTAEVIPILEQSVAMLRGVGLEREQQLARLSVRTVGDLLLHRPRRYEDRRHFRTINELQLEEPGTTRGQIVAMGTKRFRGGQRSVFEIILEDGTARLHCRWWNLPFMQNYFAMGDEVFVYGKLNSLKPRTVDHPETEVIDAGDDSSIHLNRIAPIYPLTAGLPQRWVRSLVWRTLEQYRHALKEPWPKLVLPPEFILRAAAIGQMHFPESENETEPARRRLALDEFIQLQYEMRQRRQKFELKARGLKAAGDNHFIKPYLQKLGFTLTSAQTRVLREIRQDMGGAHPMRRLLQGDVGSGKTAVAACCALMALESGFNVAFMAPTEILAEQHAQTFQRWFAPLGIEVQLRTGSRKGSGGTVPQLSMSGKYATPTIVIGTHALIEGGFSLERLGLVIIDEQHKFGVTQREQLLRKGNYPHLLVMTATPIPRTLGLTLYGELDVSTLDEMPAGRGTIKTFVRSSDKLPKVWEFLREKLESGRQAYIVNPRVEESGVNGLKAVAKEYESLKKIFAPLEVGMLHGRLAAMEKERVMAGFRAGKIKVLLATPLIEVGVDVPNATVMVIENAEQFGLAQLHQLRGRIGRGQHDSQCILVAAVKNAEASARLQVLAETGDGFKIAEADLKLRGPGEMLGQQQSGLPNFRFGDLREDLELIKLARELAAKL